VIDSCCILVSKTYLEFRYLKLIFYILGWRHEGMDNGHWFIESNFKLISTGSTSPSPPPGKKENSKRYKWQWLGWISNPHSFNFCLWETLKSSTRDASASSNYYSISERHKTKSSRIKVCFPQQLSIIKTREQDDRGLHETMLGRSCRTRYGD
jgi:hypothetical protein